MSIGALPMYWANNFLWPRRDYYLRQNQTQPRLTNFVTFISLVTDLNAGLLAKGRGPVKTEITERRAAKMKKRNPSNTNKRLRLCIGSLLALSLLTTHHSFSDHPKHENFNHVVFLSAAPGARTSLQNPATNPGRTEWDVRVWVPVELALDNSFCDSVAADYLMQNPSFSAALKLPSGIMAADISEPEPMPVFLYSLLPPSHRAAAATPLSLWITGAIEHGTEAFQQ